MIAYMMKKHRMRYEEAQQLVLSKRSQTLPNNGFREQLMQYEVKLFDMCVGDNVGSVNYPPPGGGGGEGGGKGGEGEEGRGNNVVVASRT